MSSSFGEQRFASVFKGRGKPSVGTHHKRAPFFYAPESSSVCGESGLFQLTIGLILPERKKISIRSRTESFIRCLRRRSNADK
jgi:hypothetical protein